MSDRRFTLLATAVATLFGAGFGIIDAHVLPDVFSLGFGVAVAGGAVFVWLLVGAYLLGCEKASAR